MTLETKIHNLKLWFGEYWTWWVTLNICSLVLLYAYGCQPKTKSLTQPDHKVTRSELQTEIEMLLAKARIGEADLERQEEIRNLIFNQTLLVAQGQPVSPLGVMTSILAILGIGATADDVRLRKQRKKQPIYNPTDTR